MKDAEKRIIQQRTVGLTSIAGTVTARVITMKNANIRTKVVGGVQGLVLAGEGVSMLLLLKGKTVFRLLFF